METLVPRCLVSPEKSFFLFGPRGTGKSTWLRQTFSDALWVDLLDPETVRTFSARPERLRALVRGNPDRPVVVVDEIQKVPEMLDVVHGLVEEDRRRRFVLTGSSSRKLKRSGVDLLAGRLVLRGMHPFIAAELGDGFEIGRALQHGLVPLVVAAPDPADVLGSYAALYLLEEVKMEGLVRNLGDFSRFLEAISFSHASLLNISNVARECQVERKTVDNYVQIVEDLLLCFRLPVFSKRARRALVSHPKFFFFDTGIYRSLRPAGPLDRPEEFEGCALEGLVAQHLKAFCDYRRDGSRLFFFRTRSGSEVDFVLYGPERFWAVEVKNSTRIRPADLRPLRSFVKDYPEATALLLYRGEERLAYDGVLCLPCEAFLKSLDPRVPPGFA